MFAIVRALYGAFISRWHGGGWNVKASKTLKNIIWAIPFGIVSFMALALGTILPAWIVWTGTVLATALCAVGKATGHGRVWNPFLPLNVLIDAEQLEILTFWLYGRISDFWYKTIAMGVIGFAAVSGAALAVGYVYPLWGLVIGLGGFIGKPLAYIIGRKYRPEWLAKRFEPTEVGELLTGFFAYLPLGGFGKKW